MRKWILALLALALSAPVAASYDSLTPEERQRVIKAMEMAKYYPYYDALVQGKDTLTLGMARLLKTEPVDEKRVKLTYEIDATLTVLDQKFLRKVFFTTVVSVDYVSQAKNLVALAGGQAWSLTYFREVLGGFGIQVQVITSGGKVWPAAGIGLQF